MTAKIALFAPMPSASARMVSDVTSGVLRGEAHGVLHVGTERVPEHEMSPGRVVQVRPMIGPEQEAVDRGPAFAEAAGDRVPRVPRVPKGA